MGLNIVEGDLVVCIDDVGALGFLKRLEIYKVVHRLGETMLIVSHKGKRVGVGWDVSRFEKFERKKTVWD
jgi:hypothetical protein